MPGAEFDYEKFKKDMGIVTDDISEQLNASLSAVQKTVARASVISKVQKLAAQLSTDSDDARQIYFDTIIAGVLYLQKVEDDPENREELLYQIAAAAVELLATKSS